MNTKNSKSTKNTRPKNKRDYKEKEDDIYRNLNSQKNEKVAQKKATTSKRTSSKKIRKMKPKKTVNKFARAVTLIIILGIICIFIAFSPIFNITYIEVINNNNISQEKIESVSGISLDTNIFRINSSEVKNNLKMYLENVNIKRSFPNKIILDVKERTAKCLIEFAGGYIQVDSQGYMIEAVKEKEDLPVLIGISTKLEDIAVGKRLIEEDLKKLETVMKIIEISKSNDIYSLITKIDISKADDYKLILESEQKIVYLGDCSNLPTRILYLCSILEKKKGIEGEIFINGNLDTDRVYFTPKI